MSNETEPRTWHHAGDLSPKQAWELLASDNVVLIDVRTSAEWENTGIPDLSEFGKETVTLPWQNKNAEVNSTFLAELSQLVPEKQSKVIFICRTGGRSSAAATAASAAGYTQAYNVVNGVEGPEDPNGGRSIAGWKVDGLPLKQP